MLFKFRTSRPNYQKRQIPGFLYQMGLVAYRLKISLFLIPCLTHWHKNLSFLIWQIIKNSDLEELRELGSGTFGTVYHGKWRGTDVAIKRINDRCFAGKPSEQERMVCWS